MIFSGASGLHLVAVKLLRNHSSQGMLGGVVSLAVELQVGDHASRIIMEISGCIVFLTLAS